MIRNASLTPDGHIGFNVGGTATTWRFDGVLSGDTIAGTHVQTSWFTISGPFTARRQQ